MLPCVYAGTFLTGVGYPLNVPTIVGVVVNTITNVYYASTGATTPIITGNAGTTSIQGFAIFGINVDVGFTTGNLAEAIIYSGAHSATQMQEVFNYLQSRYWAVPPTISGLKAWYRSDIGITTATGVSQWNDLSGNGYNLTQATGSKQPTLNASDANYNGQATLSFASASSQFLSYSAVTIAQPLTYYVVGQATAGLNKYLLGSPTGSQRQDFYQADGTGYWSMYAGSAELHSSVTSTNTPMVAACVFSGASSGMYINSSGTNLISGNPGTTSFSAIEVNGMGGGSFSNCTIAEIAVFSGAHTKQQVHTMMRYFSQRYGITAS